MIDNVLIDRIKKMQAKAQSALDLGLEHEALAFSSAVQKLLLKHNLSMTEVEAMASEANDPVKAHIYDPKDFGLPSRKVRIAWMEKLAIIVAKAHMCRVVVMESSNKLIFVGTKQNRQVAELMLVILSRYAVKHSQKDYVKFFYQCKADGDVTMARGYKEGWLLGFCFKLKQRYEAEMNMTRVDTSQTPEGRNALVRLNQQLQRVQDVVEKISNPTEQRSWRSNASADGVVHGMQHGDKVQIRGTGIEGGVAGQGQLSAGQKQL